MDAKERTQAANALVAWFNSQDIAPRDAAAIMRKVQAKLIVSYAGVSSSGSTPDSQRLLDAAVDDHMLALVHDVNDRLHHVRRK